MVSPSQANQVGTRCGAPSGRTVDSQTTGSSLQEPVDAGGGEVGRGVHDRSIAASASAATAGGGRRRHGRSSRSGQLTLVATPAATQHAAEQAAQVRGGGVAAHQPAEQPAEILRPRGLVEAAVRDLARRASACR